MRTSRLLKYIWRRRGGRSEEWQEMRQGHITVNSPRFSVACLLVSSPRLLAWSYLLVSWSYLLVSLSASRTPRYLTYIWRREELGDEERRSCDSSLILDLEVLQIFKVIINDLICFLPPWLLASSRLEGRRRGKERRKQPEESLRLRMFPLMHVGKRGSVFCIDVKHPVCLFVF